MASHLQFIFLHFFTLNYSKHFFTMYFVYFSWSLSINFFHLFYQLIYRLLSNLRVDLLSNYLHLFIRLIYLVSLFDFSIKDFHSYLINLFNSFTLVLILVIHFY